MREKLLDEYIEDLLTENVVEITLSFTGDYLNKNEISEKLNIQPTNAWDTNEILSSNTNGKLKIANFGKWYFTFNTTDTDMNEAIQSFFESLPQKSQIWEMLSTKCTACIELTTYQNQWQHNYGLSLKTLKLITDRNLNLSIDCYNISQIEN